MAYPSFNSGDVLNASDMNAVGLWLVKSQTIGSAQNTVTVSDVFSSTYDNYLITVSGGTASTDLELRLRLGSTNTNYYYQLVYGSWGNTASAEGSTTALQWPYTGHGYTSGLYMACWVFNPNRAYRSTIQAPAYTTTYGGTVYGMLNNTTQYTAFTILTNTGTVTGGDIRVYGLKP